MRRKKEKRGRDAGRGEDKNEGEDACIRPMSVVVNLFLLPRIAAKFKHTKYRNQSSWKPN